MKATGRLAALMVAALTASTPVRAQDAVDGWDIFVDAANDTVSASVDYASGATIVVQCQAGVLITGIAGTPLSNAASRRALLTRGDAFSPHTEWDLSAESGAAVSQDPRIARFLRLGGPVTLESMEGDPSPFRTAFALPASGAAVDQVLNACDAPLTRDRDRLLDAAGLVLAPPEVEMPEAAMREDGGAQTVYVSCLIRNSRLTGCLSERQQPLNRRAGTATARSADGTRIQVSDPAAAEGRRFEFALTGARMGR